MIENLLPLGFILFEYFSCAGTKEVSLNYLPNVFFFYFGLRHVIDDDIDSFFSKDFAKKLKTEQNCC